MNEMDLSKERRAVDSDEQRVDRTDAFTVKGAAT
jgi:hypothetical protein